MGRANKIEKNVVSTVAQTAKCRMHAKVGKTGGPSRTTPATQNAFLDTKRTMPESIQTRAKTKQFNQAKNEKCHFVWHWPHEMKHYFEDDNTQVGSKNRPRWESKLDLLTPQRAKIVTPMRQNGCFGRAKMRDIKSHNKPTETKINVRRAVFETPPTRNARFGAPRLKKQVYASKGI